MKSFNVYVVKPLLQGTDQRIEIIQKIPQGATVEAFGHAVPIDALFVVEGIPILDQWPEVMKKVSALIEEKNIAPELFEVKRMNISPKDPHIDLDSTDSARLAYFFFMIAQFFRYNGTEKEDRTYVGAVDYFFSKYKSEVGKPREAKLFKKAAFKIPS
jgi:hypothetical protein